MSGKNRTIDHLKERREAPAEARERMKYFSGISRDIKKALEAGPLTIPEIALRTGREGDEITYALMTMRKFGVIETHVEDDVDEYYRYRIKE